MFFRFLRAALFAGNFAASRISDTGQNGRPLLMEVIHRFYRITQAP